MRKLLQLGGGCLRSQIRSQYFEILGTCVVLLEISKVPPVLNVVQWCHIKVYSELSILSVRISHGPLVSAATYLKGT